MVTELDHDDGYLKRHSVIFKIATCQIVNIQEIEIYFETAVCKRLESESLNKRGKSQ